MRPGDSGTDRLDTEADPAEDRLLEAASRVADRLDVDWERLERELPSERGPIEALRRLAALGASDAASGEGIEASPGEASAWRWGHLEVQERLGEGSFGEVWRAFDPILRREVALKLRRTGGGETGVEPRVFLEEARHLARVRHPNVLGVHGADVHDHRAGLWTDLVSGRTLHEILKAHGPWPVSRVLEVGQALADALVAVHRAGLVHGDVKASNVMVESERGRIVLMDFGAAGPESRVGRFGSPLSMAPELLTGGSPSPASDAYSLGVVLYLLLEGRYPVQADELGELSERHRGGIAERQARRLAAPRPVRHLVARLLAADPALRLDARGAREQIRWIQEAPGRRRRRLAVAVVVASLAVGAALAGLGYVRSRREAERAQAVRDFVVGLFAGVAPDSSRGRSVTAKELLDRGADRLRSGLATQPALRAEMLGVVGRLYQELGLYDQARPLLEEALATRRELASGFDAGVAESAGDLASVLLDLGEYEAAEALASEALTACRRRGARAPGALAASLARLGEIVSLRGRADEADALFREAVDIDRRLADEPALAIHLGGHGRALWRAARYDDARARLEEALSILRRLHGNEHTLLATALLDLGTDLMDLGRFAEAEAMFRESLAVRRKLLGEAHPYVAAALANLGDLLQRAGRLEEAEQAHRESLAIYQAALGETHPEVANSLNHIGVLLYFRSRYGEAAAVFEQVLPLWRSAYGPRHANVLTLLNNLGAARRGAGDHGKAEQVLREALRLRREAFGDKHPDVAQSLNNLAPLLAHRGANVEAEAMFREAIATWREALGNQHASLAYGLVDLGRFLLDRGRPAEAERPLREGVAIRTAALDPRAPLLASARLYLAESLLDLGRGPEAEPLLDDAVPVLVDRWGADHPVGQRALRALARARPPATTRLTDADAR